MTQKMHTDMTIGAPGNVAVVNAPLGQLDSALADFEAAVGDYVVTGGLAATSGSLVISVPALRAFVLNTYVQVATSPLTVTLNQDTYVDVDSSGVLHMSGVANGAAAPGVFASSIRLFKAVSNATAVVAVVDLRPGPTFAQSTSFTTSASGSMLDWGGQVYHLKSTRSTKPAKIDTQDVTDGVMNGSNAILTSVSGKFAATDVGKYVNVAGAGTAAALLVTTIASFQSATQVTLTANSATAVGAANVEWGTDDTAALQASDTAAIANGLGGVVFHPGGVLLTTGAYNQSSGVSLRGAGPNVSFIRTASLTADIIASTGAFVEVHDIQLEGQKVIRTAGAGINFTGAGPYVIDNVRFVACYNALTMVGCTSNSWISHIKLAGASVGTTNRGLFFQSCINTDLKQIHIDGGAVTLGAGLAWITFDSGCDTMSVDGVVTVTVTGAGIGLLFSHSLSPASFQPRWGKCTNIWAEGSHGGVQGADSIQINAGLSIHFENVYATTGNRGVYINSTLTPAIRDIRFTNAIFLNNWLQGFVATGSTGPISVSVINGTFSDNSTGLTNNVEHLRVDANAIDVKVAYSYFGNGVLGNVPVVKYALGGLGDITLRDCYITAASFGTSAVDPASYPTLKAYNVTNFTPRVMTTPAVSTPLTNTFGSDIFVSFIANAAGTTFTINTKALGLTPANAQGGFIWPNGTVMSYVNAPASWAFIGLS